MCTVHAYTDHLIETAGSQSFLFLQRTKVVWSFVGAMVHINCSRTGPSGCAEPDPGTAGAERTATWDCLLCGAALRSALGPQYHTQVCDLCVFIIALCASSTQCRVVVHGCDLAASVLARWPACVLCVVQRCMHRVPSLQARRLWASIEFIYEAHINDIIASCRIGDPPIVRWELRLPVYDVATVMSTITFVDGGVFSKVSEQLR